jgi:enamine deaminase RidA (YjgF/YER057c/UK114 family)
MTPAVRRPTRHLVLLTGLLLAAGCASGTAGADPAVPVAPAPYPEAMTAAPGSWLVAIDNVAGNGADLATAAGDALAKLERRLAAVGLNRSHLLSVRAELAAGDTSAFAEWNTAWTSFFARGSPPARTTVGRGSLTGGAKVLLGVRAALPAGVTARDFPGASKVPDSDLWTAGSDGELVVFVSGDLFPKEEQIFLSGIIAPEGTAARREAGAAMTLLRQRLTRMGARMDQVVGLQVYRTASERGFEDAYNEAANNRRDPLGIGPRVHVVESLPGGRTIEIEATVVRPVR